MCERVDDAAKASSSFWLSSSGGAFALDSARSHNGKEHTRFFGTVVDVETSANERPEIKQIQFVLCSSRHGRHTQRQRTCRAR